jgi:hypothetical protein
MEPRLLRYNSRPALFSGITALPVKNEIVA